MVHPYIRKLPEALLALFGLTVFTWMSLQRISTFLIIPTIVVVLAGLHLVKPNPPTTQIGLGIGYIVGAALAGFLVFGILTAPIGGSPEEIEAFNRVAVPMLLLFGASVIALVVKRI